MYRGAIVARQNNWIVTPAPFWTLVRESNIHTEYVEELLIQQDSIPDGEITLPVQEGTKHTQPLRIFFLN
jgi:hypothetical protein